MADHRKPYQIIADIIADHTSTTDAQVLAELDAISPFPDEDDPAWNEETTWHSADKFVALASVAATRRLKPAIRLLLYRACYGDPGEMFRGLRHYCEAIVNPQWSDLAEICLEAGRSNRRGTRLWAIHQLVVLDDERARPLFEQSLQSDSEEIRRAAKVGLQRLDQRRR